MKDSQIKPIVVPALLAVLSFCLNLSLISKGAYNIDCLELAAKAESTLTTHRLQPLFGPGYPLTVLFGAFFVLLFRLFSNSDPVIAVNFMSVVFSAFCIFSFYILAKKFFDEATAVLSVLFLEFCPIFLGISVYGRNHVISLFFLMQGISWLISYFKSDRRAYFGGAILSFGFMGAAREQDLALMVLPLSFLFWNLARDKESRLRELLFFWLGISLIVLVFHIPFWGKGHVIYEGQFQEFYRISFKENFLGLLSPKLVEALKILAKGFTWPGLILIMGGMYQLFRKDSKVFMFFVLWIIVPVLFYGNQKSLIPRYLTVILPPLALSLGYMFHKLMQKSKAWKGTAYIILIGMVCFLSWKIFPVLVFRHNHAVLPTYARWIGENTPPNARIIGNDDKFFIRYYGKRAVLGRPVSKRPKGITEQQLLDFKQTIDALLDQHIPVYITTDSLYGYNWGRQFSDFFIKHYKGRLVGNCFYEDWHRGELELYIYRFSLYEIKKIE